MAATGAAAGRITMEEEKIMGSTTQHDPSMEELQARRQALAFEVAQGGHDELEEQLDAVEDQIDRLRRQHERQQLASDESRTRQEAEALEQAAAERRAKEARLQALHGARHEASLQVEEQVDRLVRVLEDYRQLGREIYALDAELSNGRPQAKLLGAGQLSAFLSWQLAEYLPNGVRPGHEFRRPLRELLGYTEPQAHDSGRTCSSSGS